VTSLLPPNRTPWELALSETSAERYPLPAHLVKAMWNPDTCPADMLGWLAHQLSVDVWDDAWPETEKREVCRNSLKLHRLKTTPAGIKAHVALTGSKVKRVIRPPAQGFLYAAMTEEQHRAWLDSLPQVRIYPFFRRSNVRKHASFLSGPGGKRFHSNVAGDEPHFIASFLRDSRGRELYGKFATLYDQGNEREVIYEASDGEAIQRVYIGAERKRLWHGHGFAGQGFLTLSKAGDQIVTVRLDSSYGQFAIGRGMTAINVSPQRINQPRVAPNARSFFGRHRAGRFLKETFAPLLVYDRISLHDETRMGARRKTRSFHGHGRFGIPDFTAELRVHVPMMRYPSRAGRFHKVGFLKAADMTPLRKAIEAVRVSRAFRDTVMIDTATYGQVKFSGGLRFGEFTFGEIKEVA